MRLALLALLVSGPLYAQAPEIAVCKEGQCVMPQTTYIQLQVMVGRIVRADRARQEELDRETHRADSCEEALKAART